MIRQDEDEKRDEVDEEQDEAADDDAELFNDSNTGCGLCMGT